MPIPTINYILTEGFPAVPDAVWRILKVLPWIALIALLKMFFAGPKNKSERVMHSRVVMITVCIAYSTSFRYYNAFPLPPI